MENKSQDNNIMKKISTFIVDKRQGFFLLFIVAIIYCIISIPKVSINNDITTYLPANSETRLGLNVMHKEFTTFGTASVMVANISYDQAEEISKKIKEIKGVSSVDFDNSSKHFKSASALFDITFDGQEKDKVSIDAMSEIRKMLSGYDFYVSSTVGVDNAKILAKEMTSILVIAVIIILGVLLFTSKTYMEIPVLIIVFAVAAVLNMGTNYLLGTISFITNAIAIVLQLALAIDYAVVLCHRYTEERETKEPREATIAALSKGAIEIGSSSLTAIVSLAALMFMQFRLGYDMGIVMIKAIACSLVSVLLLMPGLLMLFHKGIDKTGHRNFVPAIGFIGKLANKTRYVVPLLFIPLLITTFYLSRQTEFAFGQKDIPTIRQSETQIADRKIKETFGQPNILAVVVPSGDYEKEGELLKALSKIKHITAVTGLGNIKVGDYVLTDKMTPRMFAELTNMDINDTRLLYAAYSLEHEEYGYLVNEFNNRSVTLYEMFMYAYQKVQEGYVTLPSDTRENLYEIHKQLVMATKQLQGKNYSRMVIKLDLPEDSKETFEYLPTVRKVVSEFYKENTFLVGESINNHDLATSFEVDDIVISVLTLLFVVFVLLFTFKSAGLPILLVTTIQGSIWINFAIQALSHNRVHFISYLIVSAIQMGATINYAIFITNRYLVAKKHMSISEAINEAVNGAFPTIMTSGSILSSTGILIGLLSSDPVISAIGSCLGRGTIISIFLVLFVLPQILLLGDIIIEKTRFTLQVDTYQKVQSGNVRLDGHIRGYVSGMINANIKGDLKGKIDAVIDSQNTSIEHIDETESTAQEEKNQDET